MRFALVVNDLNEVAGRGGMGAVMGSKNLKAIAVRGTQKVPVADPVPLQTTAKWVSRTMEEVDFNFHHYGTGAGIIGKHLEGHMIVRNFQDGQWDPEKIQAIDAKTIVDTTLAKMDGCYACSVRCKKRVKNEAMEVLPKYGGPEYETIGAIGTNRTIGELPILLLLNQPCSSRAWLSARSTLTAGGLGGLTRGVAAASDPRVTAGGVVQVAARGRWHDSGRWPATRVAEAADRHRPTPPGKRDGRHQVAAVVYSTRPRGLSLRDH